MICMIFDRIEATPIPIQTHAAVLFPRVFFFLNKPNIIRKIDTTMLMIEVVNKNCGLKDTLK